MDGSAGLAGLSYGLVPVPDDRSDLAKTTKWLRAALARGDTM